MSEFIKLAGVWYRREDVGQITFNQEGADVFDRSHSPICNVLDPTELAELRKMVEGKKDSAGFSGFLRVVPQFQAPYCHFHRAHYTGDKCPQCEAGVKPWEISPQPIQYNFRLIPKRGSETSADSISAAYAAGKADGVKQETDGNIKTVYANRDRSWCDALGVKAGSTPLDARKELDGRESLRIGEAVEAEQEAILDLLRARLVLIGTCHTPACSCHQKREIIEELIAAIRARSKIDSW